MLFCYPALTHAQVDDSLRFEAGASLNRYVPDRENEVRPYFFAGEIRYKWKSTSKMDHFVNVRVAGNYNRRVTFKPFASKRYLSFEAGYHARWRRDSSNFRFSWGVNLGIFQVDERITPLNLHPFLNPQGIEPYNRTRHKFALSPQIAVEYYFNPLTFIQVGLSMSFGTRYYGDVDHLEFNNWRGFSAQAPSVGIFRKF
ncbi:MAG: hypothetical protein Crog4KO_07260 [Crocinitomicaceae bacterium]